MYMKRKALTYVELYEYGLKISRDISCTTMLDMPLMLFLF